MKNYQSKILLASSDLNLLAAFQIYCEKNGIYVDPHLLGDSAILAIQDGDFNLVVADIQVAEEVKEGIRLINCAIKCRVDEVIIATNVPISSDRLSQKIQIISSRKFSSRLMPLISEKAS